MLKQQVIVFFFEDLVLPLLVQLEEKANFTLIICNMAVSWEKTLTFK